MSGSRVCTFDDLIQFPLIPQLVQKIWPCYIHYDAFSCFEMIARNHGTCECQVLLAFMYLVGRQTGIKGDFGSDKSVCGLVMMTQH